ncbi:ABC transporter substrate-binding protein [Thermodesulfobacteriota bacterium]
MRTKGIFILVTGFILIILASNPLWAQQGKLKVGLLAPLTGINPDWGKKQVIAMEMALEKVNKRGGVNGVPIEVIQYDTGGHPNKIEKAKFYLRKLAEDDKVLVTIGPFFSFECQALFRAMIESCV